MTAPIPLPGADIGEWDSREDNSVTRAFTVSHHPAYIVGVQDRSGPVVRAHVVLRPVCLDLNAAEDLANRLPGVVAQLRELSEAGGMIDQ